MATIASSFGRGSLPSSLHRLHVGAAEAHRRMNWHEESSPVVRAIEAVVVRSIEIADDVMVRTNAEKLVSSDALYTPVRLSGKPHHRKTEVQD